MSDSGLIIKHIKRNHSRIKELNFMVDEIAKRMIERLDYIKLSSQNILDLGFGVGIDYQNLAVKYKGANIYGLDISHALLKQHHQISNNKLAWLKQLFVKPQSRLICADVLGLPIKSQSVELVWSNLTLPFINDHKQYFSEVNRVLKLGGTFLVSGLGVDSLQELRDIGLATFNFPDMHLIGDILVELGFSNPVTDVEKITLEYDTLTQLLADVRLIGCGATLKHKISRQEYKDLENKFTWRTQNGKLPLTLEIFYAHAWKDKIRGDLVSGRSIIHFT